MTMQNFLSPQNNIQRYKIFPKVSKKDTFMLPPKKPEEFLN